MSVLDYGETIMFDIKGIPVAKARPRFTKTGHVYSTTKTREAEDAVKRAAAFYMEDREIFKGPIVISLTFMVRTPASWSKKRQDLAANAYLLPTTRPDTDNYVKLVTDAMNGVVYEDDNQIIAIQAAKFYARAGDERTVVEVIEVDTTHELNEMEEVTIQ